MKLGPLEIGLIILLVLIIFGVGRLPQVGGAIGKSIREFRKATKGNEEEDAKSKSETSPTSTVAPTTTKDEQKKTS